MIDTSTIFQSSGVFYVSNHLTHSLLNLIVCSINMASERNQSEENIISTSASGSGPSTATLQQMLALSTSLTNEQNPNPTGPVDKDVSIKGYTRNY